VANVAVFVGSVRRDRKGIRVANGLKKTARKVSQSLLYRSNGFRLALT